MGYPFTPVLTVRVRIYQELGIIGSSTLKALNLNLTLLTSAASPMGYPYTPVLMAGNATVLSL